MTRRLLLLVAAVVAIAAGVVGCRWLATARDARQIGQNAATAEQARLWDAVGRNLPPGIQNLPVPANPVLTPPQAPPGQSQAVPPRPVTLTGITNGLRVMAASDRGNVSYVGPATVTRVDDVRFELQFDGARTLGLAAKVADRALPLMEKDTITLDLRMRPGARERQQIIGIETMTGTVLITAFETAEQPIVITTKLGSIAVAIRQGMTLTQGVVPVSVDVGGGPQPAALGATRQIGNLMVRIDSSYYNPARATSTEVAPYTLDLVAWRATP